jgi:NADH:ubiquinone oxidoreductase subunit 3 (subunit A)
MFPWVVSSSLLFLYTFPVLLVFILILTAGYVFDWIHKLLKW